jgi:hypothetical protein
MVCRLFSIHAVENKLKSDDCHEKSLASVFVAAARTSWLQQPRRGGPMSK